MNRYTSKHLEDGIIHNNTNTLYESYNQPNCGPNGYNQSIKRLEVLSLILADNSTPVELPHFITYSSFFIGDDGISTSVIESTQHRFIVLITPENVNKDKGGFIFIMSKVQTKLEGLQSETSSALFKSMNVFNC